MKLAQTKLNAKITIAGIIAAVLIVGLSGCGKSAATKAAEEKAAKSIEQAAKLEAANQRIAEQQAAQLDNARQKFKESVAAVLVRTKGSTHEEFRQSRLSLETAFQSNKAYLTNIYSQFSVLSQTMTATENIWNRNTELQLKYPSLSLWEMGLMFFANGDAYGYPKPELNDILTVAPSLREKLKYTKEQRRADPDFDWNNYVSWGLAKVETQCDLIISILDKPN